MMTTLLTMIKSIISIMMTLMMSEKDNNGNKLIVINKIDLTLYL